MTLPADLRAALTRGTPTADECARVLAWVDTVAPACFWCVRDKHGNTVTSLYDAFETRFEAENEARWRNYRYPHHSPHTVHRLAAIPAEPATGGDDAP